MELKMNVGKSCGEIATYSFDGHDWAHKLSGHLKFLLLQKLNS